MSLWFDVSKAVVEAQAEMARKGLSDRLHYCYRCYDCGRLITKLEVLEGRYHGRPNLCPCGSARVSPTNAHVWEELLLPRCWKLIFALYTKRISPAPAQMTPQEQREAKQTRQAAMLAFEKHQVEAAKMKVVG